MSGWQWPRFEIEVRAAEEPAPVPAHRDRSPALAVAFARLEIAWRLDDVDAAYRILRELQGTPEGEWLSQAMAAAVVTSFSDHLRGIPRQQSVERDER